MADMQSFWKRFIISFGRMSIGEKLTIATTLIGLIIGVSLLMKWATRPDYALLFNNLDLKEADKIVESLKTGNIPYEIKSGGTAVFVPSSQVYEWRMKLASEGLPSSGSVGYEIFDQKSIGISDFVQKINYGRALEGELARTIMGIDGVEYARVHVVIPHERLFQEDQKDPTASIAIRVKPNVRLGRNQVAGITNLVAASVEGLRAENVTVIDSRGNILSNQWKDGTVAGMSSGQMEVQRQVESNLQKKAQTMLDAVLGQGKSIVRVSAELNFKRVDRTEEKYDPENVAILSEERTDEANSSNTSSASNGKGQLEHSITNYKVPKTVERIIDSGGNIKRISVAVLVDGKEEKVTDSNGAETVKYKPRNPEELSLLKGVVQNAVGFNPDRNDKIEIQNMMFEQGDKPEIVNEPSNFSRPEFWFGIGQKAFPVIVILIMLFILKSKLSKIKISVPSQGYGHSSRSLGIDQQDMIVPNIEANAPPETIESAKLMKQITNFVEDKPGMAARLVRYWMLEE
ncbi:flagellar M-ring protein FliF [bacterium]|nr:flagellar M-ring protein FliF [bacterium]